MYVISKTTGRLGNAIFRYFACIMFLKNNPSFKYGLYEDIKDELYEYYHGKDFEGNDIGYDCRRNINLLKNENYEAFNTLGYIKQNVDVSKLLSNSWINPKTNHGLYVRKPVSIIDESIFHEKLAVPFDKSCMLHQWYQFDGIYLENKQYILDYIQAHKHEHYIQTDEPIKYLMKDVADPMLLPPNKLYEVVIHIRLGDFNGRPDFIEYEYMEKVFNTLLEKNEFRGRIALCIEPPRTAEDKQYLGKCLSWFKERNIEITCESNSLFVDFNIMRQAKIVVSSMSTLCWTAVFLSKSVEKCYMPDYDFSMDPGRKYTQFKTPIHNTEFYEVKTTKLFQDIKVIILTLEQFPERIENLKKKFLPNLTQLGLRYEVVYGVNGSEISVEDTEDIYIKKLTYKGETKYHDTRVRPHGIITKKGEFGCAWAHLNLYEALLKEENPNLKYLIFEDDVEECVNLEKIYNHLANLPKDFDMIHLGWSEWYPFVKKNKINKFFYDIEKRFFCRLTAYCISHKCADTILQFAKNYINVPSDDLLSNMHLLDLIKVFVPEEHLFHEPQNTVSTIGLVNKHSTVEHI